MVVSRSIHAARTMLALGLALGPGWNETTVVAQSPKAGEHKVTCEVNIETKILLIAPDGLVVKKGQLICELDSSAIRQKLADQRIIVEAAANASRAARAACEIAEIAKQEYTQGIFKQDLATVEGEVKLAESDLVRSADRFEWATRMHAKGFVGQAQKVSEELNFQKATFALKQAQEKLQLLKKYSGPKTIKSLDSTVDQTRFDARARDRVLQLEQARLTQLEQQVERCRIFAPADGRIVHAHKGSITPDSARQRVDQPAVVHEGELLFRIVPLESLKNADPGSH